MPSLRETGSARLGAMEAVKVAAKVLPDDWVNAAPDHIIARSTHAASALGRPSSLGTAHSNLSARHGVRPVRKRRNPLIGPRHGDNHSPDSLRMSC
jgi:hypothetical protein